MIESTALDRRYTLTSARTLFEVKKQPDAAGYFIQFTNLHGKSRIGAKAFGIM